MAQHPGVKDIPLLFLDYASGALSLRLKQGNLVCPAVYEVKQARPLISGNQGKGNARQVLGQIIQL